jgi:hypothetical protein
MTRRIRPLLLLLVLTCIQQIAVGHSAFTYEADAQIVATADPTALPPGYHSPYNIVCYDSFFNFVGAEHDLIEQEKQQGKQVTAPTDYSSAIGIDDAEVQTILDIVLPAYHRRTTAEKQFKNARDKYHMAVIQGNAQGLTQPDVRSWMVFDRTTLDRTYVALKQALPADDFKKLDAYVSHNFRYARDPGQPTTQQSERKPFPKNVTYELFIQHVANEDSRVTRELQQGKPGHRQTYSMAAHFPQEEELPVRAILLAANRRLVENGREQKRILGEWTGQYGEESRRMSPPPEFQAAVKEEDTIVQETIDQLKQELGDDSFNKFDSWIAKHYGGGQIIGVPSTAPNTTPH